MLFFQKSRYLRIWGPKHFPTLFLSDDSHLIICFRCVAIKIAVMLIINLTFSVHLKVSILLISVLSMTLVNTGDSSY